MSIPVLTPHEQEALLKFAREAGDYFEKHPEKWTYTSDEIAIGEWFAVRWGLEPLKAHAVLVFKVGSDPVIYGDLDADRSVRGKDLPF